MTNRPSGLRQSEAILARNLFGATPAEAVSCSSSRICSRMVRATSVAAGRPVLLWVTSRYASSRDRGSTSGQSTFVCRVNESLSDTIWICLSGEWMAKKYCVTLTAEEREELQALLAKGKASARKLAHARVLLPVEETETAPGRTDQE